MNDQPSTKTRRVLISIAIVLVVSIIGWAAHVELLQFLSRIYQRIPSPLLIALGALFGGVTGSIIANLIYAKLQREVWHSDVSKMTNDLGEITRDVGKLKNEYSSLLKSLPQALGGSFTKSLFEFHPMASKRIANILSLETARLYRRHHKRVIVTKGSDTYRIRSLDLVKTDSGNDCCMWKLDFCIMWEWLNDSKVPKDPLGGFLILVAAPMEALDDFFYNSQMQKESEQRRFTDFFLERDNYVRAIVPHPLDPNKRVPDQMLRDLFGIERLVISHGRNPVNVNANELKEVSANELPNGVYRGLRLPLQTQPLNRGESLTVEYRGWMRLAAPKEDSKYSGRMSFPPSDVIGNEYKLTLVYPESIQLPEGKVKLEIKADRSGCQFLHEPLENHPVEQTGLDVPQGFRPDKHDKAAQIKLQKALTDLHNISMEWYGQIVPEKETA